MRSDRFLRSLIILWGTWVFSTACVSIRPGPFQEFQRAVFQANRGIETEMARNLDWTREADVDLLAGQKAAPLSDYMLTETSGTSWKTKAEAPHEQVRRTLRALEELNTAFQNYTTLLTRIAEGNPAESQENQRLAVAVHQNLLAVQNISGQQKGKHPLWESGATALGCDMLLTINGRRRLRDLKDILGKNQQWVQSYSTHCRGLLGLIRADMKIAYADRMASIQERWDDKRTPGRNTLARMIFNLNEEYGNAMSALGALDGYFEKLPEAHRSLVEGLSRRGKPSQRLAAWAAEADRIARLIHEMEKSR